MQGCSLVRRRGKLTRAQKLFTCFCHLNGKTIIRLEFGNNSMSNS